MTDRITDRLKVLFEHIEEHKNSDTPEIAEQLLISLSSIPSAFFYLYENLTPEQKPKISSQGNFITHFGQQLYNVLARSSDEIFNKYFFDGLSELIDISIVRKESIKRKDNEQLTTFIRNKDKFKNVDALLVALQEVYTNKGRFNELIEENKKLLSRLNSLTKIKSRGLEQLSNLLNLELEHTGFGGVIKLCEKIGFDLLEREKFLSNKLSLHRYNKLVIKTDDIEVLEDLFDKTAYPDKFTMLASLTDFRRYAIDIISKYIEPAPEIAYYLWTIYEEYILTIPKISAIYQVSTNKSDDEVKPFEILKNVVSNERIYKSLGMYSYYSGISEITNLERGINKIALTMALKEKLNDKQFVRKAKI